jgi:hypothetical protein
MQRDETKNFVQTQIWSNNLRQKLKQRELILSPDHTLFQLERREETFYHLIA